MIKRIINSPSLETMYAIIRSGGKQYRVEKDSVINVDLLSLEEGSAFETTDILFVKTGENDCKIGTPVVEGAKVTGTVLSNFKAKKIIVFKKKRRKNYKKKQGHRQQYTKIQVTGIEA